MKNKKVIITFTAAAVCVVVFFGYRAFQKLSLGTFINKLTEQTKEVRKRPGVTYGDEMLFEKGAVYYSATGWDYVDDPDSIRLSKDYTLNLQRGDGIFVDNEELQYCIGIHTSDDQWKYVEWRDGGHGFLAPADGEYSIVVMQSSDAKEKKSLEEMAASVQVLDNHNEVARTHLFPDDYTYTHGHSSGGNAGSSPRDIPENSIEGAEYYANQGYWGVSCDIRLTADGEWVLCHDATVDRTTDHTGNVHDYTLAELQTFQLQKKGVFPGYTMPSLNDWLDTCVRLGIVPVIQIEYDSDIVTDEHIKKVVDALEERGLAKDSILGAFEAEPLLTVKKLNRSIVTLIIARQYPNVTYDSLNDQKLEDLAVYGNVGIFVNQDAKGNPLTLEYSDNTHSWGIFVGTWTSYPSNRQNTLTVLQYHLNLCGAEVCPNVNDLLV